MKKPIINILTRTSSRPIGFANCEASIVNQAYENVKHIVSYEDDKDLIYLKSDRFSTIKVNKQEQRQEKSPTGYIHAPYNLYCNTLLDQVEEGWIVFLDDDNNLLHNKVLKELSHQINLNNDDTLFIWKLRYPDGRVLPSKTSFTQQEIAINKIDSSCFMFHSKYKDKVRWDQWKGSDFRFLEKLSNIISNQKWINQVYIQINNFGDFGKQNDITLKSNKLIYNKSWFWYLLPKYHTTLFNQKIFSASFYKKIKNRLFK